VLEGGSEKGGEGGSGRGGMVLSYRWAVMVLGWVVGWI
jgi:hypothetical protein